MPVAEVFAASWTVDSWFCLAKHFKFCHANTSNVRGMLKKHEMVFFTARFEESREKINAVISVGI